MTGFHAKLAAAWRTSGSMLCLGLDPEPARLPVPLADDPDGVARFCTSVIDATADLVCAFKPQFAHFAAQRAEGALERVCAHVREHHPGVVLILDAKRGDIGSTARYYADEAFGRYGADAVTYNPYLGTDAAKPLLERGGVIALCRTSNPGSGELQDLDVGGAPLFVRVAEMVSDRWAQLGECGLVVGATYADQLRQVRDVAPSLPILVPGVGAQGGDVVGSVQAGATGPGTGLMLSASRSVLYASSGEDFADAARTAARRLVAEIEAHPPTRSRRVADGQPGG